MNRTSRRDAHGTRIDLAPARLDLLIGQQGIVDALAVEVAVAHHLGAAQYLRIERERAVHVLHREAEVLHALQPRSERPVVACRGSHRAPILPGRGGARRRRGGNGKPGQHGGAGALQHVAALLVGCIGSLIIAHVASPREMEHCPQPRLAPRG
jgi:hypothetical protein